MQPSHTFSFPEDKRDAIERNLRATTEPKVLTSVRPERQKKPVVSLNSSSENPGQPAPTPAAMIQVDLQPATPMTSPDAISIELPSRFHYYSFKDLYVKPLRVTHLAKLSKAVEQGSLQIQVEAISSVLETTSGEKDLAFKLTSADYNAVLYWLRLSSFSKPSMRVTSVCRNPEHHKMVKAGVKTVESLQVQTSFNKSDLKYDFLTEAPNPEIYKLTLKDEPEDLTFSLTPETMADTIAFLDHPDWANEEFQYKSKIASTLGNLGKITGKTMTWDQRIQIVDEMLDLDQATLCMEFVATMDLYGVRESVDIQCKECGWKGVERIACDPQTFLTPSF